MKVYVILLFIGSLIQPCQGQNISIYRDVLDEVKGECELIKEKLDLDEQCEIEFSTTIIELNITPFHDIVDSLNLIDKSEGFDSFAAANLFDLENYMESYQDPMLEGLANQGLNNNIRLYCSDIYSGLMTCEAVEKDQLNPNNELIFGRSVLFLFKITESNEVQMLSSIVLTKN